MDTFPTIAAPTSIDRCVNDPYIESEFESGDDAARPVFSTPREGVMTLKWPRLRIAQFESLRSFCASHRAVRFLWLHPTTAKAYVVRLKPNSPRWSQSGSQPGTYAVDLQLQIVREA